MKTPKTKTRILYRDAKFVLYQNGKCQDITPVEAQALRSLASKSAAFMLDRLFVKRYTFDERLPSFLDEHQKEGVQWILTRSRSYLAHAPGAGKTCEAIVASCFVRDCKRILFIVPPTLTVNWEREIKLWSSKLFGDNLVFLPIQTISDSSKKDEISWAAHYFIVPDSMLTKKWVLDNLLSLSFDFVAVDEASRFKNPEAERSKALFGGQLKDKRQSPGLIYGARYAVLLDGSPMPNRHMEMWAPTYAMSPQSIGFMSQRDFGVRYCNAFQDARGHWQYSGSSRSEELHHKLTDSFMHVVTEDRLGHPERMRSITYMDYDPRTPEMIEWEKAHLGATIKELVENGEMEENENLSSYRRKLGLSKVPWVVSYIRDKLNHTKESILLFAWHREVCVLLEDELAEFIPGVIIGGTPAKAREEYFNEFQNGERRILILNILAGGRGHNLQRASRVVFAEYAWTDETNKQCEKRASRKGSKHQSVRCEYVIAGGTLDEVVLRIVREKEALIKKVITTKKENER